MQGGKVPVIRIQRNNQQGAMPWIDNVLSALLIRLFFSTNKHKIDVQTYSLSF